ncbi:MAG: HD-GYP domain-containing protein [Subdoligranulum sp.]
MLGTSSVVALQHHERLDGSGYLGLQDAEIHPHAKIVAVADVFDALISPRPYKRPWDIRRVSDYLKSCAGVKWMVPLSDCCWTIFHRYWPYIGTSTRITCKIRISPIYTHRGRRETKLCCYRKNSISSIG